MIEAMIDIETLSTRNDAIVPSIGAIAFTSDGPRSEQFFCALDIDQQFAKGRRLEASTLCWWMDQSAEARAVSFPPNPLPVFHALVSFSYALKTWDVKRVWAKGTHFDIAILEHLFAQFQVAPPWRYNEARDTRTYMDLLPTEHLPKFTGVAHRPLDDCHNQIVALLEARKYISRRNGLADAFQFELQARAEASGLRPIEPDSVDVLTKGPLDGATATNGKFYP